MLALLAPPSSGSDDYERYIATGRNNELEDILEQPSEKRSTVKKEIFIKGRQESIDHVLNFIAHIVVFARFWVKMSEETTSQPTFIQILVEVADYISTSEYKLFNEKHIATKAYMPHTLIAYLFNIISVFVKMGKNRKAIAFFYFWLTVLLISLSICAFRCPHQHLLCENIRWRTRSTQRRSI